LKIWVRPELKTVLEPQYFGWLTVGKAISDLSNPFTTETRLKIDNNGLESMHISIYSMDGGLVRNEVTPENEYVWHGNNQVDMRLQL